MYDELVKELRYLDEYSKQINPTPSGIFREAADAIEELIRKVNRYENVLTIPEPGRSVYGYPLNELLCFAQMCRRHEIEEKDLHDFCVGVENGFRCGVDDWNRVQNNMIQKMMERFNTEPPKEE